MRRALFLSIAVLGSGCERRPDDPAQAYQAFVRNLQKGETKAAFDGLSSGTRRLVEARAQALSAASDGGVKDDPQGLLFAQLQRPSPMADVAIDRREGDQATLKVSGDAQGGLIHMVKEDAVWKLDLTDALK